MTRSRPMERVVFTDTEKRRIWNRTVGERTADGCLLWKNNQPFDPTPHMFFRGKQRVTVARLQYAAHTGPIAEGQSVIHTCGNRHCVAPEHLVTREYVTQTHAQNRIEALTIENKALRSQIAELTARLDKLVRSDECPTPGCDGEAEAREHYCGECDATFIS